MALQDKAPESSALPFAGVFVVDFGVGVAGVEVARLLVEYGAEVVKIESSKAVDFVRIAIPGPMNGPFSSSNRNKQSFGVNLKTEAGVELVKKLVAKADVVVENSGTGVMERLGFGYEAIKEINPSVIMLSSQIVGSRGPWKNWIGYGPSTHPVSGLQYLWNYPEDKDEPAGSTNIHPDHLVGRTGALGVVAAMIQREREGRGAHVEIAQFEAIIQLLGDLFARESIAPGSVEPQGNSSERGAPWGAYECDGDDQWCVINVRDDADWKRLREALGNPDWATSPTYDSVEGRREAHTVIDEGLTAWTLQRSGLEATEILQNHGVPAGLVVNPEYQANDPHLAARDFFHKIDQFGLGDITLEGLGIRGTDLPRPEAKSAPLLGQHTREICASMLGLTAAETDALFAEGVLEETLL